MKKIISLCTSLFVIFCSVTASANIEISNPQGSTIINCTVSLGELEYATEAMVMVYDGDENLNYADIIPIAKDGTAEFSYDNQGNSGNYTFYIDVSAFNKSESATLENFIGVDYWNSFTDKMAGYAQSKDYESMKTDMLAEKDKGLLDVDLSVYDKLTNKDNVWKIMAGNGLSSGNGASGVLNGFYSAVYLCRMNETNDASEWYEAMKDPISETIPKGENSIVIDEYTKETKAAILAAVASSDYSKTSDAYSKLLEAGLFKAIEKANHYTDVKKAVQAYYNAGYITVNPQKLTESHYKAAMGKQVSNFARVNNLFKTSSTGSGGSGGSGGGSGGGSSGGSSGFVAANPQEIEPITEKTAEQSGKMTFSDMEDAKWALKHVELLYEKGIVSGIGNGLYNPHKNVTRAEMAKMMVSLGGFDLITCEIPFSDVDKNEWYYPYVCTAYKNGIFSGIEKDMFGVTRNITRQEQAAVLYRLLEQRGTGLKQGTEEFADGDAIGDWAKEAVYVLRQNGVLSGRGGNLFCPQDFVTRAEAAVFVANTYNLIY